MIIEKPVATSIEEVAADARRGAPAGVKTVVSFVLRWNPWFRTLKAMLADNAFGRPYYVETDYLSHNGVGGRAGMMHGPLSKASARCWLADAMPSTHCGGSPPPASSRRPIPWKSMRWRADTAKAAPRVPAAVE